MRDVPSQCQPADSLIVFERRLFEQEKPPGSQPVSSINTDTHQAPDSRQMNRNTEKGWLRGVQSGRTGLEVVLCLICADFLYQEEQSECPWLSVPLSATVPATVSDLPHVSTNGWYPNLGMYYRLNSSCVYIYIFPYCTNSGSQFPIISCENKNVAQVDF